MIAIKTKCKHCNARITAFTEKKIKMKKTGIMEV